MSAVIAFTCPRCEYRADAASAADGSSARPEPGDITLCLRCGCPMEFAEDMVPRWLTCEELAHALDGDQKRRGEFFAALVGIVTMRPSLVVARPLVAHPATDFEGGQP